MCSSSELDKRGSRSAITCDKHPCAVNLWSAMTALAIAGAGGTTRWSCLPRAPIVRCPVWRSRATQTATRARMKWPRTWKRMPATSTCLSSCARAFSRSHATMEASARQPMMVPALRRGRSCWQPERFRRRPSRAWPPGYRPTCGSSPPKPIRMPRNFPPAPPWWSVMEPPGATLRTMFRARAATPSSSPPDIGGGCCPSASSAGVPGGG